MKIEITFSVEEVRRYQVKSIKTHDSVNQRGISWDGVICECEKKEDADRIASSLDLAILGQLRKVL